MRVANKATNITVNFSNDIVNIGIDFMRRSRYENISVPYYLCSSYKKKSFQFWIRVRVVFTPFV